MSDTPRLPEPVPEPGLTAATPNGQAPPPFAPRTPRRSRGWIWYFVILALLTVGATATLIIYNLAQQLTPQGLTKARSLWQEKGPKDYDYSYTTRAGDEDRADYFVVVVRGGKVRSVTLNKAVQIPKEKFIYYGMPALFDFIEDFLEMDGKPGAPKVFKVGRFSPVDGHLVYYVRRVMGTRQRVEITVERFQPLKGK